MLWPFGQLGNKFHVLSVSRNEHCRPPDSHHSQFSEQAWGQQEAPKWKRAWILVPSPFLRLADIQIELHCFSSPCGSCHNFPEDSSLCLVSGDIWYNTVYSELPLGFRVLGVLVPIVIWKQVADKIINMGNRELIHISRYSHPHGWIGKQTPRGHVACPKPEELQGSRAGTCSQVCLTLISTRVALGVLKFFFFLNFLYFTVCIIKTFKEIWEENISLGCSFKNPFFKGAEIKFILFSCSGFHLPLDRVYFLPLPNYHCCCYIIF